MTKIQCPRQSCKKEFEIPVMVTNFTFTPTKETYPACPYCLARIDENATTCECTTVDNEPVTKTKSENCGPKQNWMKRIISDSATVEKIGELEKQKTDLLAQLEELKQGATKKITKLEQEVVALKQQKEYLEQMTN